MTDTWNVHPLPGVVLADLEQVPPAREALLGAMGSGLTDVVIVGRRSDGAIGVWGSQDSDAALGLLTRGISWLTEATQVNITTGESA